MEKSLYYILRTARKQSGVAFAFCGVSQTKPNHSFGPALRNAYIIHIVLNGTGMLRVDDTVYFLEKNDCFVIQPDDSAEYRSSAGNPWTYCWLGFTASDPAEYLSAIGYTPSKHAFRVTSALPFLSLLTECFSYTDGSVKSELKLNAITFEVLFRLANNRVPLDSSSSILGGRRPHRRRPERPGAHHYHQAWREAFPQIKDRARSMGGWTATLLGQPDADWTLMVAFDRDEMVDLADELVALSSAKQARCPPHPQTGASYNPTDGTPVNHTAVFAVIDYSSRDIDGTRVLASDKLDHHGGRRPSPSRQVRRTRWLR